MYVAKKESTLSNHHTYLFSHLLHWWEGFKCNMLEREPHKPVSYQLWQNFKEVTGFNHRIKIMSVPCLFRQWQSPTFIFFYHLFILIGHTKMKSWGACQGLSLASSTGAQLPCKGEKREWRLKTPPTFQTRVTVQVPHIHDLHTCKQCNTFKKRNVCLKYTNKWKIEMNCKFTEFCRFECIAKYFSFRFTALLETLT